MKINKKVKIMENKSDGINELLNQDKNIEWLKRKVET